MQSECKKIAANIVTRPRCGFLSTRNVLATYDVNNFPGHFPTEDPLDDELIVYEHMVVHMANPAASEAEEHDPGARGSISSSFSMALSSSASKVISF